MSYDSIRSCEQNMVLLLKLEAFIPIRFFRIKPPQRTTWMRLMAGCCMVSNHLLSPFHGGMFLDFTVWEYFLVSFVIHQGIKAINGVVCQSDIPIASHLE